MEQVVLKIPIKITLIDKEEHNFEQPIPIINSFFFKAEDVVPNIVSTIREQGFSTGTKFIMPSAIKSIEFVDLENSLKKQMEELEIDN